MSTYRGAEQSDLPSAQSNVGYPSEDATAAIAQIVHSGCSIAGL